MSDFSYSKISLFEKCPKSFHYKYIQGKDEYFSTIEQHLGKTIHTAIEYTYQIRDEGYEVSINFLTDAFHRSWNLISIDDYRIVKSNMSAENYYSEGIKMLKDFFNEVLKNDKSRTLALEKYFSMPITPSINYRGYIDRISIESNGLVRIIDYKSGKRINEPAKDKQLSSYAIWALDKFQLDKIEIAFAALKYGKISSAIIKRSQIPHIKNSLLNDVNQIMAAKSFKANPSMLCDWCGYNPICDEKNRSWTRKKSIRNDTVFDNQEECPLCGADLEERDGRYGSFIGCTEFPNCRYTRDDW